MQDMTTEARESASVSPLIRGAEPQDEADVCALLIASSLPLDGVREGLPNFVVARVGDRLAGVAGMERCADGESGLLRSVAVDPSLRSAGLGNQLVARVMENARQDGIRNVFLLTTTAAPFFRKLGFSTVERVDVPEAVRATEQFASTCPSSAEVMKLALA